MRSICLISILVLVLVGGWTSYAEKTNVFFVHGANVSEQDARAWASQIFKRLWQSGAQMEFYPIAWESDIGPSYNYQVNASNAFVTASRLASYISQVPGRMSVRRNGCSRSFERFGSNRKYGKRLGEKGWTLWFTCHCQTIWQSLRGGEEITLLDGFPASGNCSSQRAPAD